jgi:hypothetical protein
MDAEEDGAVTVLKLSNGVMLRVTVEVQGMQLQAVADTAAQFTLVSEEFNKSLDPAPPNLSPVTSPPLLGPRKFLLRIDVSLGLLRKGRQYTHPSAFPFLLCL